MTAILLITIALEGMIYAMRPAQRITQRGLKR